VRRGHRCFRKICYLPGHPSHAAAALGAPPHIGFLKPFIRLEQAAHKSSGSCSNLPTWFSNRKAELRTEIRLALTPSPLLLNCNQPVNLPQSLVDSASPQRCLLPDDLPHPFSSMQFPATARPVTLRCKPPSSLMSIARDTSFTIE